MTTTIDARVRGRFSLPWSVSCCRPDCEAAATVQAGSETEAANELQRRDWQRGPNWGPWHCPACLPERQLALGEAV